MEEIIENLNLSKEQIDLIKLVILTLNKDLIDYEAYKYYKSIKDIANQLNELRFYGHDVTEVENVVSYLELQKNNNIYIEMKSGYEPKITEVDSERGYFKLSLEKVDN